MFRLTPRILTDAFEKHSPWNKRKYLNIRSQLLYRERVLKSTWPEYCFLKGVQMRPVDHTTFRVSKWVAILAEMECLVIVLARQYALSEMASVKAATLTAVLPEQGIYEVCTTFSSQVLVKNFFKKPVVLHRHTRIALDVVASGWILLS